MECVISKSAFDALKAATLIGDIDSFCFQYVHKGVEFYLDSKNENIDHKFWDDVLHEVYFENELPESTCFYPKIEDGELVLDYSCSADLTYEGLSEEFWDCNDLIAIITKELKDTIVEEISQDDIILYISLSAHGIDGVEIERFDLEYVHPETGEVLDLSHHERLKELIKLSIYKWADGYCNNGSAPDSGFSIEISESVIIAFTEHYSGRVELIVE